jgi:hypothetical protein
MEFLHPERFRKGDDLSKEFEATLEWHGGPQRDYSLGDSYDDTRPQRVRYLPQRHIEQVCNQLHDPDVGVTDLERELRAVIFQHLPQQKRLGTSSLDELIELKSKEAHTQAEDLRARISNLNKTIVGLETETSDENLEILRNALELKQEELRVHDAQAPAPVPEPDPSGTDKAVADELEKLRTTREQLLARRDDLVTKQAGLNLRLEAIARLASRIANLERQVATTIRDSEEDAALLGLQLSDLISLTVDHQKLSDLETATSAELAANVGEVGTASSDGLEKQLADLDGQIASLADSAEEPVRKYEAYIALKRDWEEQRAVIVGKPEEEGTIENLQERIRRASGPALKELEATRTERLAHTKLLHEALCSVLAAFKDGMSAIKERMAATPTTSDSMRLDLVAVVSADEFAAQLLSHINQNRTGSFHGVKEGSALAGRLAKSADFVSWSGVRLFLESVDKHLRFVDADVTKPKSINSQLMKGRTVEALYDTVYGLRYLKPHYALTLGGKDIPTLSPGEKGALLILFRLLFDPEDIPLVIDQPEYSLDNESVIDFLKPCFKAAKARRQLILVTHCPNLAVVCDAEQVIHASIDKAAGNTVRYTAGAIEDERMNKFLVDVLEGKPPAFKQRKESYQLDWQA